MYMECIKKEIESMGCEIELKEHRITVQVTETEKKIIKMLAKQEGLSVSDYIRRICIHLPCKKIFKENFWYGLANNFNINTYFYFSFSFIY